MLKSEPVNKLEPVYETETADYPSQANNDSYV